MVIIMIINNKYLFAFLCESFALSAFKKKPSNCTNFIFGLRLQSILTYFLAGFFSFTCIYAQNNPNLDNLFRLAQGYEFAGQYEKAEPIYRNLFEQQNWNFTYFEALNKIIIKQKKYSESIELLQNRIKQTPQDINLYGMLGSTYFMMDDTQNAYGIWEKGIETNPKSNVVYRVIANYAIENRAYEKAISFLERGKKFTDDPTVFSLDLANIYAANMRFDDAANEYCIMLESRPAQIGLVKSRITSYLSRQGSAEPTIETIKKFTEEKPLPQILDLLTFIYTSTDKFEDAFSIAVEYDRKANSNGNFIFTFAQDAYRNKKYDIASKAYNYLIQNFQSSQLIPIAKIGYANTLEAGIVEKNSIKTDAWKPFKKQGITNSGDYYSIIDAYEQLARQYKSNAVYPQALFNMANVYAEHLLDFKKADSLYSIINQNHSVSNYSPLAFIQRGKIAVLNNNLENAKSFFTKAVSSSRGRPDETAEADFYLARIEFWLGNFTQSLKKFQSVTKNLSTDFANDALELSSLISASKRDSLNLYKYAKGDLFAIQNKFKEAVNEFKTLADNPNLFIINEFAKYKLAQMLIADDDLPTAIKILEILSEDTKSTIFADKSFFLLAQTFQYGIKDVQKAVQNYEKLLERFPNSLYFDRARESLKELQTNNG